MKTHIKNLLKKIPIAITRNQKYDKQTKLVLTRFCSSNSNFIDIGAHKGEVLDLMYKVAPQGTHYAFEPIPDLYKQLKEKYADRQNCLIYDFALNNKSGTESFNYVVSNPAYSGLIKRSYDRPNEVDTEISVKTELLDNILPDDYMPTLIKIDVEGGELGVLQGAQKVIARAKPYIIFEHGLGASDHYNSYPENIYSFFQSCGMEISTMERFLSSQTYFNEKEFCQQYYNKLNHYFIAYKT